MDPEATVRANQQFFRAMAEAKMAESVPPEMRAVLEQIRTLPDAQREAARKAMTAEVSHLPEEQRELALAFIDGKDIGPPVERQAVKEFSKRQVTVEFRSDDTFHLKMTGEGTEDVEGTWSQSGNTITVTATKKNGKAPEDEDDKKPKTLTLDGESLVMATEGGGEGLKIHFRKR
jgi:hypothetical protein